MWYLQGADYKSAMSLGNPDPSLTVPGINGTDFKIWIDFEIFTSPDVLFPEDNTYPLEIISGPIEYGGGFVYNVRLQGDTPERFLDPSLLDAGRKFDKVWTTLADELNDEYGTQQSPALFMLESQISTFGQKIVVSDKACVIRPLIQQCMLKKVA